VACRETTGPQMDYKTDLTKGGEGPLSAHWERAQPLSLEVMPGHFTDFKFFSRR